MSTVRKIKKLVKKAIFRRSKTQIRIGWVKKDRDSWLWRNLDKSSLDPQNAFMGPEIERLAEQTNRLGPLPLWKGYENVNGYPMDVRNAQRSPNEVRTLRLMGIFFAELAKQRMPSVVVEVGTAFGVSAMYWLSGLESNRHGKLLAFEPNEAWAEIAKKNLSAIGNRYRLVPGTFEENIDSHLASGEGIDIAFIDAIHTSEFVLLQFEMVLDRLAPNGIILIDDIDFSKDMKLCWKTIAFDERVRTSATLAKHVGIVEIGQTK